MAKRNTAPTPEEIETEKAAKLERLTRRLAETVQSRTQLGLELQQAQTARSAAIARQAAGGDIDEEVAHARSRIADLHLRLEEATELLTEIERLVREAEAELEAARAASRQVEAVALFEEALRDVEQLNRAGRAYSGQAAALFAKQDRIRQLGGTPPDWRTAFRNQLEGVHFDWKTGLVWFPILTRTLHTHERQGALLALYGPESQEDDKS